MYIYIYTWCVYIYIYIYICMYVWFTFPIRQNPMPKHRAPCVDLAEKQKSVILRVSHTISSKAANNVANYDGS